MAKKICGECEAPRGTPHKDGCSNKLERKAPSLYTQRAAITSKTPLKKAEILEGLAISRGSGRITHHTPLAKMNAQLAAMKKLAEQLGGLDPDQIFVCRKCGELVGAWKAEGWDGEEIPQHHKQPMLPMGHPEFETTVLAFADGVQPPQEITSIEEVKFVETTIAEPGDVREPKRYTLSLGSPLAPALLGQPVVDALKGDNK